MLWTKRLFYLFILTVIVTGCNNVSTTDENKENVEMRTIIDMAGREVEVPSTINKVFSVNSIGTIFLYTMNPEKIVGWNSTLGAEKYYLKEEYHDLPVLGTYKGPNSMNLEELLKTDPDLIINMGDINDKYVSESDELQNLTGIPVVMIDGSLEMQADAYTFLGDLLDEKERAQTLATYSQNVMQKIEKKAQQISEQEKKKVYYAAGLKGLETVPYGSINTEVLDLVGGMNVADIGLDQNIRRVDVSLEQIIQWDPEIIIISPDSAVKHETYNNILDGEAWQPIQAVKEKQVYEIPYGPYDWFNRPPSVMRLMGMMWLGNLLYPDTYQLDLEQEMRDFFELFFDYSLNEEEIEALLERSVRKDV